MDDFFIYIYYTSPLGRPTSEVEDDLDEFLDDKGEVVGTGVGDSGGNVDIELESKPTPKFIQRLMSKLRKLKFPEDTIIDVCGQQSRLKDHVP